MDQFTQSKVKALANAVEAWGIGQQYVEKIKAWQVGLIPEIKRIFNPNKESGAEFLVLCHGDLWLNNQLFKYDNDDNVTDVIFVSLPREMFSFIISFIWHILGQILLACRLIIRSRIGAAQ